MYISEHPYLGYIKDIINDAQRRRRNFMKKTHQLLKIIIWLIVISTALVSTYHGTLADKMVKKMSEAQTESPLTI
jgi:hypothetical protein